MKFTQLKLKSIQEYFVYLDVAPIIALQILEYKKLIDYALASGTKILLVSYFRDEYEIFKTLHTFPFTTLLMSLTAAVSRRESL